MKANFRLNNEWNCPRSPLLHFDKRQGLGKVMIFKMEYLNFRTEVLRIFSDMTPPGLFLGLMACYQYDCDRKPGNITPHPVELQFAVQTIHDPSFLKGMLSAKARGSMRSSVSHPCHAPYHKNIGPSQICSVIIPGHGYPSYI